MEGGCKKHKPQQDRAPTKSASRPIDVQSLPEVAHGIIGQYLGSTRRIRSATKYLREIYEARIHTMSVIWKPSSNPSALVSLLSRRHGLVGLLVLDGRTLGPLSVAFEQGYCKGLKHLSILGGYYQDIMTTVVDILALDSLSLLEHLDILSPIDGTIKDGVIKLLLKSLACGICPKLKLLELPASHMSRSDFVALADALEARWSPGCEGLRRLPFANDGSRSMAAPAKAAKRIIRCCLPTLTELHIGRNVSVEHCIECLISNKAPALVELDVGRISWDDYHSIVKALEAGHAPRLEQISFNQRIGEYGNDPADLRKQIYITFSKAIEAGAWPKLKILRLANVGLQSEDVQKLMEAAVKSPHRLQHLQSLDLSYNDFGIKSIEYIAKAIEMGASPCLEELHLISCDIEDEGLAELANALKQPNALCSKTIKALNLKYNSFGAMGTASLATALAEGALSSVETLHLDGNSRIKDEGVRALAEALASGGGGQKLRKLDLQSCDVRHGGAMALADAFERGACANLEMVDITGAEEIGERALTRLAQVMADGACPALKSIGLGCAASEEDKDVMREVLRKAGRNRTFIG